ncbi:MAG TPA: tetratricopeptide repeat protein [Candidatus Baltobacteraceae bacterium]|nr:tetratricopeptide repeat protein [Candidatus Baltobacteraceae bacterium]
MIDWRATLRRFAVVTVALACAALTLRGALSSALVTRGDVLLYARGARARVMYRRALEVDPANLAAADRYVFAGFLSRRSGELRDAIETAGRVLQAYPHDTTLRMDRALCLQLLKNYDSAEREFERVGRERRDVEALALAAADARRTSSQSAISLLLLARSIDPRYLPVRAALARLRR